MYKQNLAVGFITYFAYNILFLSTPKTGSLEEFYLNGYFTSINTGLHIKA